MAIFGGMTPYYGWVIGCLKDNHQEFSGCLFPCKTGNLIFSKILRLSVLVVHTRLEYQFHGVCGCCMEFLASPEWTESSLPFQE